ncbi:MAG: hypothetical protein KatS3mg114_0406 [Planctomycetaceae bacterium]|nr:MAG: hypothetical protein KatS3mg114_0406 [Planctomycetaceae bacterium]
MGRDEFLLMVGFLQGLMVGLALLLAWGLRINPWEYWSLEPRAWVYGVLCALPLCLLGWWLSRSTVSWARSVRALMVHYLGPSLAACHWFDLLLVALLVGITEELLFRGVLQVWLMQWNVHAAVIVTGIIFGTLHSASWSYMLLTSLAGCYLGATMLLWSPPNLLIPMLAHAATDLCSFLLVRRSYLAEQQAGAGVDTTPEAD